MFLRPEKIKENCSNRFGRREIVISINQFTLKFSQFNISYRNSKSLSEMLENESIRKKLVAAVCAIEGCTYKVQIELTNTDPKELAEISYPEPS
ncbi:hypothetical protein [Pedobacter jamesrossensis]|uniref:hypothetical protein n=1 Tax=Pedobacter jamesrossensis TaxID=1908238 RepID=UPI0036195322